MSHMLRIAWVAVRELFYERVFYLLASFGVLSLVLSMMLGQLTYAEQAKLTIDFMLGAIHISMVLFSVFMGISLFHRELIQGSVSMVLSKPISRVSFLTGKFVGQLGVQFIVMTLMGVLMFAICARFEESVSFLAISQTLFMIFLEIAMLTAITYFFAVNAGAITAAVATLILFCLGHFGDTIDKALEKTGGQKAFWKLLSFAVPDLEVFNMKSLASYGQSVPGYELGWASLYAVCGVLMFLALAAICFERKDILT